jgi:hypothetical protein
MQLKKRILKKDQQVIIVFEKHVGFIKQSAIFKEYKFININNYKHKIPVFESNNRIISGETCFWILDSEYKNDIELEKLQYSLIKLQIKILEIGLQNKINFPIKISDERIVNMAKDNVDKLDGLVKKLGFDPRDESWIETDLANSTREKNWFEFERKNPEAFNLDWKTMATIFNQKYKDDIIPEQAKNMSKKRMRYLLGSFAIRIAGNADKNLWKQEAIKYEKLHREKEIRMNNWSVSRNGNFPIIKTKKTIRFFTGPYFTKIIEIIPHLFTDQSLSLLKSGTLLRIISFDKDTNSIRLDFSEEIRKKITGKDNKTPWIKDEADYEFYIAELNDDIELLEQL